MRLSRLLPHSLVKDFVSLTYQDAVKRRLVTPFIVFISFLSAFIVTRLFSYSLPSVNFVSLLIGKYLRGYYIHHFYFGIALLIASNWLSIVTNRQGPKNLAAVLFGFGLGGIVDEIGLLLTCTSPQLLQCNYGARITLDFFIIIVGAFLAVLYFMPVWRRLRRIASHTHGAIYNRIRRN
ncbi:hypothetical protein HYU17_02925 [Candidatus Woesearchaeota archaeon]|nr:hypothetical protein [Candidatus Woesearchaeota archaeon]